MGVEKQGSKGVGGFFQLFDWNGKSRKKLFANKSDLPDGLKQGKKHDENLPTTRFCLIEDDEQASIAKGGSDYSCASSVTDDDASGIRAPSVVARLMGLESLPTCSVSESHMNLLHETRALRDSQYQRKTHEFLNDYRTTCTTNQSSKIEGFSREIVEPKPQKMQSRLIERFQSEPIPPKSAKAVPVTHHKLLSPIKSPGFISPKSAAHIMEAAAKILEPGLLVGSKGKLPVLASASVPIKVRDLKENASTSQRQLKLPEASKRLNESNAVKMLKGQSLNKSWNGPEETPVFRVSDMEDTHSVGSKSKSKSVSLAVQAKVNVQRREGLGSGTKGPSSASSSLSRKEEDDFRSKQPAKNMQSTLKNKQNKSSSSVVLRQNNIKQNCATNREKVPYKPPASNQQGRKILSGDSAAGRSKTLNKVPTNGKGGGCRKDGSKITESEKEHPSSKTKNLPRKKRALEVDYHGEKSGFVSTNLVDRDQKAGQSRVTINEHANSSDDSGRRGMDVVSFTFTSPMVKPLSGSQSSGQMAEKSENLCYVGSQGDRNESNLRNKKQSSLGLNVIGGDALSVLLEQKLRELTSGLESSSNDTMKTGNATASASLLQDLISALNSVSATPGHSEKKTLLPQNDQLLRVSNSSCFSTDSQVTVQNLKFQGPGQMTECTSSSNIHKEFDYQHPSPVSILEASFSSESCNSSESCESGMGCKQDSSTLAHCDADLHCPEKTAVMEAEAELSDSASSAYSEGIDREQLTGAALEVGHIVTEKQDMEYVRDIISHAEIRLGELSWGDTRDEIVESPLFEKLEIDKYGTRRDTEEDKEAELRRKSLFDCVGECLNTKHDQYMRGGYKEWAQGMVMLRSKKLAEDVYKDILGWRSMADWMVDELVDKDMSTGLGKWTHYEAEGFEVGLEIEKRILSCLIDEVVAGFMS